VAITFSGWRASGQGSESVATDEELAQMMAASFNNSRMVDRTIFVEVPLD
jgi:hypothetical protein